MDGGIGRFLGLVRDHRGAVEYDWRNRFGISLYDVGDAMNLAEASRLAGALALDPSSHVCAAASSWKYPISTEALIAADQFDAFARANFKNPKPYPRPWVLSGPTQERLGVDTVLTQDEVIAALRAAGHDSALPT